MNFVEAIIHPLVKGQFPQFYVEEGPRFIEFAKEYYRWSEQANNALNISRNLLSLRDVDSTADDLFIHFKQKYLTGLPIITEANKALFLKHIVNLYNSKGTERGVQLLMRAMFNESAEVFYPGDNILKTSAGVWYVPKYLELTITTRTLDYIGKEIIGNVSGAKAFVEKLTLHRVHGKYFNVVYLSNVRGEFVTGEYITESTDTILENAPSIVGSLTELDVLVGGADFAIGDVFDIVSDHGKRGKARVTALSNQTGTAHFSLIDGGWGYSNTANVLISAKVLSVSNVINSNVSLTAFGRFETVTQNLRSIAYTSSPNSSLFTVGSLIENYNGGGAITSNAVIVTATTSNSSVGTLLVCPITGAINSDATFSLSGNTTTGVISTFTNVTASGNVIAQNTSAVGVISILNTFHITPYANIIGGTSNTRALISNTSTGSQANFAVKTITNQETDFLNLDFLAANNAANVPFYTIFLNGNNAGYSNSSLGFPNYAAANVGNILLDVLTFQSITIGTIEHIGNINPGTDYNVDPFIVVLQPSIWGYGKHDHILEYANATGVFLTDEQITSSYNTPAVQLTVIGFTGTHGNGAILTSVIQGEFIYQSNGTANIAQGFVTGSSIVAGSGSIILQQTNGTFVNTTNSTLVMHSLSSNGTANITNVVATSVAVVARGFNKDTSNTTALRVKRVTLADGFVAGQSIVGVSSGATATIVVVSPEETTEVIGINANVQANVQTSNNAVTGLVISDSGFGYIEDEVCSLIQEGTDFIVSVKTHLGKQGVGTGFYTSANGFLSDVNKLQDGSYYQDFSYEVQTKIPFNKYFDILKQTVHLAGTKAFGRLVSTSVIDVNSNVETEIDIS